MTDTEVELGSERGLFERLKNLLGRIKNNENLHFIFTTPRVIFGISLFTAVCLFALLGPAFAQYDLTEFAGSGSPASAAAPSWENPFGLTILGHDVYTRTVYGLRSTILVGFVGSILASSIGIVIGLVAGYIGGMVDEFLMGITNVFLTFPQLAILIVVAAYLPYRGVVHMAMLVGLIIWPWTARAVRSQTLSIKNEEHVELSRMSSNGVFRIMFEDIAANMFSYIFMVFIQQFLGTIMATVGLEFLGLGPTRGVSLGLVMQRALTNGALYLGYWWWGILPGLFIMLLLFSLYFINTGLDELFNPELREM
ncbi:MAG: ABC transporter permease [Candidatus Acetothermia bacterium]